MLKNLLYLIIFIIVLVAVAFAFSLFFQPEETLRYDQCVLLQNPETQEVDCFGCVNDKCKDASRSWILYEKPEIGIPYACFESEQGCGLAQ
jgi:hypothetical protein